MHEAVTAACFGAVVPAGIGLVLVAIITGLDIDVDDAIATARFGTVVAAGIVFILIGVITGFDAGLNDPIAAASGLTGV